MARLSISRGGDWCCPRARCCITWPRSDGRYYGAKVYATNPKHGAHFLFLLYRAEDAKPLAIIEANHLGQIRTGAASGLATRFMAREDASTLGIIGSGFQAGTQLEAMLAVRRIRRGSGLEPDHRESAQKFAAEATARFGVPCAPWKPPSRPCASAEIVVTATYSKEPVLAAEWVGPDAHINAMGSNQANRREIPAELVKQADLIAVDSIEQARMEVRRPSAGPGPGRDGKPRQSWS